MRARRIVNVLNQQRTALVAYLCVGDPHPSETLALARAAIAGGADILELGIPFSDPSADGKAIALASERALTHGTNVDTALSIAKALRSESEVPIVMFGYYNPLLVYGEERFVKNADDAGVDAILCVDLPFDEPADLRDCAREAGISMVPLVSPTTTDARLAELKRHASSQLIDFVYYVSIAGVTGAGSIDADAASARGRHVLKILDIPTVVGFGIDSVKKARDAANGVSGVVVGSALVNAIGEASDAKARILAAEKLVSSLRHGLDA